MLAIDRDRVGFEQAGQPQGLVDLIKVVHPVVIADHFAHARTAAANQAVVGFTLEGQGTGTEQQVTGVDDVGHRTGATPGVVAHAIHAVGTFTASGGGNALRELGVEPRRALAVERFQRAEGVLRAGAGAAGEEVDQRAEAVDDASQQGFTGRAWWNLADKIGCGRALVRCTDAGGRGNQARFDGRNVTDGRATMAVADQVDLGLTTDGDDLFHLGQQLFAAGFRGIQLADFGDIHTGAVAAQCSRDAVPVVDAQDAVEAEHAVGQYHWVLGLGVARGAEPEGVGVARGQQAGAQAEGEQGFIVVHWCSR